MSEEVNRSQQRENLPSIIYYGFAPFGFPSQPVQQAPLHRNQTAQVVRRQAASEQAAPLDDEHAASSSRTVNPSIGNALDPRENAALTQPIMTVAPAPAMPFMPATQQQIFAPPSSIGCYYYIPARQNTISGLASPNSTGPVVSMNIQAAS
ncbi:hypothetical protein RUND412_002831 [Rhizina undulata]